MVPSDSVLDSSAVLVVGQTNWATAVADALRERTDAAVERVDTASDALDAGDADCVVTAADLPDDSGVALTRALREHTATLPVILGAASGSERLASDAVAAGVSEYVAVRDPLADSVDETLERAERAVREARRTTTQRERARQFDAIFHDARTATWVLDADGRLERVNQTARDFLDANAGDLVGDAFWTLPWWPADDGTREDIRRVVDSALDGGFGHAVVTRSGVADDRVVELSAQSVTDERGNVVSVVVEGVDTTERVDLERDLRQSEQLHRVTLSNMTDTVLMTDEDGEYTYVCPNVHFIFGYTADEIRDLGPIDELLGDDLFDREELAEGGVLKNIEVTATDKAGREHTLLVNVREVSIQDGTLLYSCRDITMRKQREQALATLQETARDFLYAETHGEIAQQVVADAASVLDLDATAVYLFDADDNDLRPAAHSQGMRDLHGPLPTVHADGETLPSYSFVEDEPLFFDDVHDADRLGNPATDLRSAAFIPLGNHGVFVAGSNEVGAFDEVTRELADLLAATAEAALDRVRRESRLREQDRELQRQNDQLTTLNRTNETIREIDRALVRAETHEEIDRAVCERLADDDRFRFAWVGSVDAATGAVTPRAWAGDGKGYLDEQSFDPDADAAEPAVRTAATGDVTKVANVPADLRAAPWRKRALARDFLSALSIPLAYNDLTHGVLTVYAATPDAFDETIRTVLEELGETIAAAISASERKRALLTTSMTRVEFDVTDRSFVLAQLARAADCTLAYEGGVQQTTDGSHVFVVVEDAAVDGVVAAASDLVAVDDARAVGGGESGGVVRLALSEPFVATSLADHGAILRNATVSPSETHIVVDVPERVDARHVTQLVERSFADADLAAKQTREQASENGFYAGVLDDLTARQLEVLETAYYSGFFESPRKSTGEDVADSLGISPQAFYQHVRAVQRKLVAALVDDHVPIATSGTT
ncbi:bacterio-opsin activator domain-containing protein [Halobacterium litoreum]|uniref:Bacterio-opsin activator domain-containing protein n=1 Tax=Halobacterium litoreum TaxID=2039234 RepID=A0ABD5NFU2_9EURY|nr:bacterio-opsin activator domain-containing protein [Halobacterium litoreum]UHH12913.1 GAF domain-containing protein [Halobacterium litoreum]